MVNESNKIIVKVGKKSILKFSNTKVYRALTVRDLELITEKYSDCNLIVIEEIEEYEQESIKNFIVNYIQNSNNRVLFFIPDKDEYITSGIADELVLKICITVKELYEEIYKLFNINVSTLIEDRQRFNQEELSDSLVGEFVIPFDTQECELESSTEVEEDISEETDKSEETELKETEANTEDNKLTDNIVTNTNEFREDVEDNVNDTVNLTEETTAYIEKLKEEITNLRYDNKTMYDDMISATKNIKDLEKIVETLKNEKQAMVDRYNTIIEEAGDKIYEDPITLSEYNVLKESISEHESTISELTNSLNKTKEKVVAKTKEIEEKIKEKEELENIISEKDIEIKGLKAEIESGEIHKEVIAEYEAKIAQIEKESSATKSRLEMLEAELIASYDKISEVTERAEKESEARNQIQIDLQNIAEKFKETEDEIESHKKKNDKLKEENELKAKTIEQYKSEISQLKSVEQSLKDEMVELKKSATSADQRVTIAEQAASAQRLQLEEKIRDLETKLEITRQQLSQKEEQYNKLVETSGLDGSGASAMIESNKTLERMVKTYQEQLSTNQKELARVRNSYNEAIKQVDSYKNQCKTLQHNLETIADNPTIGNGFGNLGNINEVKPINYRQQTKIFTVMGSGSFGITTTAVSLAQKLSATSKTIIIDFDFISPMIDAWFKKNPILYNIPGTVTQSEQNTGLGIFVEHGMSLFEQYIRNIVILAGTTKGGGLYYLSGLYSIPEDDKLISADYEGLFNLLGKHFSYIIIDFGKLGNNKVYNSIIKAVSDIAFSNIVVTTSNQFEIRNFKNRLNNCGINTNKIAWLVNMCNSTSLEEKSKFFIGNIKYDMLPRLDYYGRQETFLKAQLTKERFNMFVDRTVFNSGM